MEIYHPASDNRRDRSAFETSPIERRVPALRFRFGSVERPLVFRIEDRNIAPGVLAQGSAPFQTEDAGRVGRTQLYQPFQTDDALVHKVKRKTNRSFKPGDTKRRLIKLEALLVCMMWRVIGGNRINRSVS